jgi:hypothetical protein
MQLVSSAPGVEDVAAMPLGAAMRRLLSHADQQAARLSCKAFAAALDPHISHSSQRRSLQELASKLPSLSHLAVNVMEEAAEQP